MGMVVMSKRELNRLDVSARLDCDRLTARAAADLMTPRQAYLRGMRRFRIATFGADVSTKAGRFRVDHAAQGLTN
jgi:hypothetical protein